MNALPDDISPDRLAMLRARESLLRVRRERYGKSMSAFAQDAGLAPGTMSAMLRRMLKNENADGPTLKSLVKLARATGLTISELVGETHSAPNSGQGLSLSPADIDLLRRILATLREHPEHQPSLSALLALFQSMGIPDKD